jgi:hypothetical protein
MRRHVIRVSLALSCSASLLCVCVCVCVCVCMCVCVCVRRTVILSLSLWAATFSELTFKISIWFTISIEKHYVQM